MLSKVPLLTAPWMNSGTDTDHATFDTSSQLADWMQIKLRFWMTFSERADWLIGLPVSIPLRVASLTETIASGTISVLTKKYQKKLSKVTNLIDIMTPALAVFEMSLSKALKNGKIDEQEFNMLQTFHLNMTNELTGLDRKMEAENRNQFEKYLL